MVTPARDWTRYAEQAAQAAYESGAPVWPWEQLSPAERDPRIRRMVAALGVVGPQIVAEAQERIVAAALRTVERERDASTRR